MRTRTLALLVSLLTVSACGGSADTSTPEGTVAASYAYMADGFDLAGMMTTVAAPSQLADLEATWNETMKEGPSPDEAMEFRALMLMLTADDAEEQLFIQAKPMLAEMQQSLTGVASLITLAGMSAVSAELDEEEQQQYQAVLGGMATWLGELDITDEDRAKESIGILCAAARDLDIKSLDQVQALSFEEALERGGTAIGSVMDVFKVYGLDLEGVFESAEIGEPVIDGTAAKVPVTVQMFGEDYEFMQALQLVDGKWYADTGAE